MKKTFSLLKATIKGNINVFKYNTNNNSSLLNRILLPLFLSLIIMFSIGQYTYTIGSSLHEINLTFIMLTLFIIISSLITIFEGIYKSQSILFEAKDNDLLFSLPIKKSSIIFVRTCKLIIFQYIYNTIFILPAFISYIILEIPNISFYLISLLMLILLPIIPTIIASFIGYFIKSISSGFKYKKIIQIIFTTILFLGIFIISFNMNSFLEKIVSNATSINDIITRIYYPAALYIKLISNFKLLDLILLLLINIIPFVLFIYLLSILYFKVISKSNEEIPNKKISISNIKVKKHSQLNALTIKELKRYFSSFIYVFNTIFGLAILLVLTIGMNINLEGLITSITTSEGINIDVNTIINMIPKIYLAAVTITICLTSITSSSISLEGKSFLLTKSLPVSPYKILLSKVLASNIITMIGVLFSSLIFIITFKPPIIDILFLLLIILLFPTFIAIIGLLINLKYPKMNWNSDTEVVKQSISSMVSVLFGMISGVLSIVLVSYLSKSFNTNYIILMLLLFVFGLLVLLNILLKKYGNKRFKEINV